MMRDAKELLYTGFMAGCWFMGFMTTIVLGMLALDWLGLLP